MFKSASDVFVSARLFWLFCLKQFALGTKINLYVFLISHRSFWCNFAIWMFNSSADKSIWKMWNLGHISQKSACHDNRYPFDFCTEVSWQRKKSLRFRKKTPNIYEKNSTFMYAACIGKIPIDWLIPKIQIGEALLVELFLEKARIEKTWIENQDGGWFSSEVKWSIRK